MTSFPHFLEGITHAARNDHRRWPIRIGHFIGRQDADHQPASGHGALRRNPRRGAAATADDGDAQAGKQFACLAGQFVGYAAGVSPSGMAPARAAIRVEPRATRSADAWQRLPAQPVDHPAPTEGGAHLHEPVCVFAHLSDLGGELT